MIHEGDFIYELCFKYYILGKTLFRLVATLFEKTVDS